MRSRLRRGIGTHKRNPRLVVLMRVSGALVDKGYFGVSYIFYDKAKKVGESCKSVLVDCRIDEDNVKSREKGWCSWDLMRKILCYSLPRTFNNSNLRTVKARCYICICLFVQPVKTSPSLRDSPS